MPTSYPKCSPTEMQGLLVLLSDHKGSEDVALLADDLDLEIDEILPALDFAELLGLLKVTDGRATFTELGQRYVAGSIRDRKSILREQLGRTTLFRTLLRALESSPDHRLTDDQLNQLVSITTAPADDAVQNIVNWGRYTGLLRYDADEHVMVAARRPAPAARPPPSGRSPPGTGAPAPSPPAAKGKPAAPVASTEGPSTTPVGAVS